MRGAGPAAPAAPSRTPAIPAQELRAPCSSRGAPRHPLACGHGCRCGKAPHYGIYASHVETTVCVDWPQSLHGVQFTDRQMDLNLPFDLEDAAFDTVLATDVVEHIREIGRFWSEACRICKVGGHIIFGTPFLYGLHETPHDYARYTKYDLIARCEAHGLEILRLDEYGGAADVIADVVLKQFRRHPRSVRLLDALLRNLVRLPALRKHRRRSKGMFPLGYCLVARKP